MREIRSYGSVGERGGNKPLYPEKNRIDLQLTLIIDNLFKNKLYFYLELAALIHL